MAAVEDARPSIVLNAAAFHKVERCETEPALALATNESGARNVARAAATGDARCIFVSTDYVFDGTSGLPYAEDDPVSPISMYGRSKVAGERAVLESASDALVIRTSGLFGHAGSSGKGGNFVETIIAKAENDETISVVDDQVFSPTSTRDLAERILLLAEGHVPAGIYHATNDGQCSWYELARMTLDQAGLPADLSPTRTDPNGPVRRPPFSVLLDSKGMALGLPRPRHWKEALAWYLAERPRLLRSAPTAG